MQQSTIEEHKKVNVYKQRMPTTTIRMKVTRELINSISKIPNYLEKKLYSYL